MDDESIIDTAYGGRSRSRSPDRAIAVLAARQHGTGARRQLAALGLSHRAIDRRVAAGRLHVVWPGVYAVGHTRLTRRGRWMAAVLAAGPGAVLSHRPAATLWSIRSERAEIIDVTAPRFLRPRAALLPHRGDVPPDETTVLDGIPVTTVPRTLLDLAAVVPRRDVERALGEAEHLRLTDRLSLPDLLARHPGRRGTATMRAILATRRFGTTLTRSELEEAFLAFLERAGLPIPELNAPLPIAGTTVYADCLWRSERLVVELDGRAAHDTANAFESDRRRDRLLAADGWRVVRITWRQLHDEPEQIAGDLRRVLQATER